LYNTASTATYSYLPAFKHFNKNIKILHFIGDTKPWNQTFNPASMEAQAPQGYNHLQNYLQFWWNLFCEFVHPALNEAMVSFFVLCCISMSVTSYILVVQC
jgi:glycogenin glucosyltransferase